MDLMQSCHSRTDRAIGLRTHVCRLTRLLCLLVLASTCFGCESKPLPKAKFIIPTGFRGAIRLQGNTPGGVLPGTHNNITEYVIPPSGELLLRGDIPFSDWQSLIAQYSDGSQLVTEHDLLTSPDGTVKFGGEISGSTPIAMWVLRSDSDGSLWLYVGPQEEYLTAKTRQLTPGEIVRPKEKE